MLEKTRSRSKIKKTYKTSEEQAHMSAVADLGCLICHSPATIHHCGTYMGGGRNHMRVLPLCEIHHLFGPDAIDGKIISKRQWEKRFGTEEELLELVRKRLASVLKG